ncbi:hypothetical protein FJQ54_14845 [Sandaracinobacter neustonicus]|uniref:Uncharacterized protein n=1 Tax=Sandaracinobacter neustonicus TaxID=1715348 RepID=A0A501XEQ3_9SPHN|nr:hypothetical protein [Sandaracinobacter neustonicus]TPE59071.1 hypothetical protein FJQ54_14845 [Sandaracinobacter neustonicus]
MTFGDDTQYSSMFSLPVMDRIFGTHHLPDHFPPNYGIDRPDEMAPLLPFAARQQSAPSAERSDA